MFRFTLTNQFLEGNLIYVPVDFSFDTIKRKIPGVTSVLVNDLQIEISINHLAIAVWGMCPHTTWQQGHVLKPVSKIGKLWLEKDLTPGVSIRVNQPGDYWPVTFDPSTGWLLIGKEKQSDDQAIEFIEGCIVLLREGNISGLWLHPDGSAIQPNPLKKR